jgi:hypothetical protein
MILLLEIIANLTHSDMRYITKKARVKKFELKSYKMFEPQERAAELC